MRMAPRPHPMLLQPPVSPGSLSIIPSTQVCFTGVSGRSRSSYLALLGEALIGQAGWERRSAASRAHELPATAHHVSPGAWLCEEESQSHLREEEEQRGARGRRSPDTAPGAGRPSARGAGAPGGRKRNPLPPPWAPKLPAARRPLVTASPSSFL